MLECQRLLIETIGGLHEVQKETNNRVSNLRQAQEVGNSKLNLIHAGVDVNQAYQQQAARGRPALPPPREEPAAYASAGTAAVGLGLIFVVDQAWSQLYGAHIPPWLFVALLATLGAQALLALLPRWWVTPLARGIGEEEDGS